MRATYLIAGTMLLVGSRVFAFDLLWSDDAGIHREPLGDPTQPLLFETFETRGIVADVATGRLWWSDVLPLGAPIPGGVIRSGNAMGGEITDVVKQLTQPAGVALDMERGRVYWTDLGDTEHSSAVFSANLDGSDLQTLVRAPWLSEITGVCVDSQRKNVYFTYVNPLLDSLYNGGIARADLDGSNVESIVDGLVKPLGIAVDVRGGNLYWAHARGLGGTVDGAIESANLEGQQHRTILAGLEMPYGVALDLQAQDIYWTDMVAGKVQRTAMSGILPFFEDVVTGLNAPTAIAIIPEPHNATMAIIGGFSLLRSGRRRLRNRGRLPFSPE